ncbi:MAG TPA: peptide-binding protein [Firmicutes bacterium]|nr:peptide-binding protein [Candidatus Fermentithermobacillaceae bacterium]
MYRKLASLVAVILTIAVFVTGCGSGTGQGKAGTSEKPTKGGQIVYGMTGDPVIFNPILATDTPSAFINDRVYSGLVRANEKLELIPNLAEKWEFSDDGLVWTFHLKKNVYWHDGTKFTSADVKFTYEAIKHPDYTGVRRTDFKPITKIEAPDDYTVKLYLDKPYAPLLSKLTIGIIPKHIFESTPIAKMKENPANMNPIGTGPYKFKEWQKGQYILLEANDKYFGEGPYIEKVIVKFYQDEQVMLAALEKGDIDYMGSIPADEIARMKEKYSDRFVFKELPTNGYDYIGLKQTNPIFKDKRVRQALMYGLNREQIVKDVLKGYGTVMNANIPPVSWAYAGDVLNQYPYNPEKAKQLLEEAGWKPGPDGIRVKDGQRLSFKVLTATGNKEREAALLIAQQNWKQIGVEAIPEYIEWSVLCSQYLDVAKFESYLLGWSLGLDPDCYLFFHSSAAVDEKGQLVGFNDVEFKNAELDQLLEQGRTEMNQQKRKEIYAKVQKIINEELPYVFLFTRNRVSAMNKKIQGVVWSTLGPLFPEKWYIKQ